MMRVRKSFPKNNILRVHIRKSNVVENETPLVWIWPTEKKMNTRNYTFQHVNIALKIKNNQKEKDLGEKSWKNIWNMDIFLNKWLYFLDVIIWYILP